MKENPAHHFSPVFLQTMQLHLSAVESSYIANEMLTKARKLGRARAAAFTHDTLDELHTAARLNPITTLAYALGMIEQAVDSDQRPGILAAYIAAGVSLTWWGYYVTAFDVLQTVLSQLPADISPRYRLISRWYKVLCERRIKSVPDATEQLMSIAEAFDQQGDELNRLRCQLDAASMMIYRDPEQAAHYIGRMIVYAEDNQEDVDLGIALLVNARRHLETRHPLDSHEVVKRAISIFERIDAPTLLVFGQILNGLVCKHQRNMNAALEWFQKARDRAANLNHQYYRLQCLEELSHTYFIQGDLPRSAEADSQINQILADHLYDSALPNVDLRMGNRQFMRGEFEAAEKTYLQARRGFRESNNQLVAAICTMNLGITSLKLGRFAEALRRQHEALDTFQELDNTENQVYAYHNLGRTYAGFGYFEPAVELFQTGILLAEESNIKAQSASTLTYLARLLAEQNRFGDAFALLDRADEELSAANLPLEVALCVHARADLLTAQGKTGEALPLYRAIIDQLAVLEQSEAVWNARLSLAQAYLNLQQSKAAEEQLEQLSLNTLPISLTWRYHNIKGHILDLRDQPGKALAAYSEALCQIRSARRSLHQEEHAHQFALALLPIYHATFSLALRLADPHQALVASEMFSSQILSTRLGSFMNRAENLDDLPEKLTSVLNDRLDAQWTVLRYAWNEEQLWLFVLTPSGLNYYAIMMDARTRAALQTCTSPDISFRKFVYVDGVSSTGDDHRRHLYDRLLPEPVRNRLEPDHTLIVVPSHQLHGLAFQTLLADDSPLIEQTRVVYAQSLEMLYALLKKRQRRSSSERGLILAQTTFEQGYPPLSHINDEVRAISGLRASEIYRLPEDQMRRDVLQMRGKRGEFSSYGWMHVATHAAVDNATGAFTGLLLGSDVLDLQDILQWRLNMRMVTLSACQSGMGRWYYGDEVAGLAQAFISAGAASVVASQWLVSDSAETTDLMTFFYREFVNGHSPPAALTTAQREAHRAGVNPIKWAPFSVFGMP